MSAGSTSTQAIRDHAGAELELSRRGGDGLRFASVRHALGFMFERGAAMQAPLGQHPRGHLARDGSTVHLRVDGGRGGDIDEVLSTLQSIHDAMAALRARDHAAHDVLRLHCKWGLSFTEIEALAIDRERALRRDDPRSALIAADITTALPRDAVTVSKYAAIGMAAVLGRLRGTVIYGVASDELSELREVDAEAWVVRVLQTRHRLTLREIERFARTPEAAPEAVRRDIVVPLPRDAATISKLARVAEAFVVAHRERP